jgi:molybdate transport system ATP-binding protein
MLEVKIKRTLPGFSLDVVFSVNEEVLGIIGPSGSGKTMTLQCIAGLIQPDQGLIKLNDKVLFDSSERVNLPPQVRKVGLVFQNYALFPHLTTVQNIAYGICNCPRQEVNERVDTLIKKMNLNGLQNRYPKQLSSGQQQRVAIARALAPEPEVLLMDEPFSALDSMVKEQLEVEVMNLQKFYRGHIILVTHNLAEAYRLSSKLAVYESGRVIQCDQREKVVSSPVNKKVARITKFSNLMDGIITEIKDSSVWVTIPELDTILKVIADGHKGLVVNQSVTIGIRPEYVRINQVPGQNTFLSSLDRMVESIATTNCFFYLDTSSSESYYIETIFPKSDVRFLKNGQPYYLYLPPENLAIIAG